MAKEWTLGEKTSGLKKETEYAVLVSVITPAIGETQAQEYLDELEFLADTAGAETIKRFTQRLQHPEQRTFVGSGKVKEIREYLDRHERSNEKKKNGWVKDMGDNVYKANRKAMKKARKAMPGMG